MLSKVSKKNLPWASLGLTFSSPKKDVKDRDDYCKNDGDSGGFIRRNHGLEELIPLNINIGEEGESNGRIETTTVAPNQPG